MNLKKRLIIGWVISDTILKTAIAIYLIKRIKK